MRKLILLFSLALFSLTTHAQTTEDSLKNIIVRFFTCMQQNDTISMRSILHKDAFLLSITSKNGVVKKDQASTQGFLKEIAQPLPEKWEEKILNYTFLLDETMATVWTEYDFIYKDKLWHSGVNQFTFSKNKGSSDWMIISIMDTRYLDGKGDEQTNEKQKNEKRTIDTLVNNWHKAAAKAKANEFFELMSDSCIYKGTDKTERWTKSEFYGFAKPFFDKGSAWDFKPLERHIRFDDNMNVAWFDEKLDTWMGICKATGILQKENGAWKLVLYDLSVTIDNDKIKSFIELSGVKK